MIEMALAYPDPELSDEVVRVRPWRQSDIQCVRLAASDPSIPSGTTLPGIFTPAAARAYIERQWARLRNGEGVSQVIADSSTDEALGQVYVGVRPQSGVVGLGYWVVPGARRRGFASRAASLVSSWLLTLDGVERVEAWVEPENHASLRVLAAAGFVREGVLRSFLSWGDRRADAVVLSRITPPGDAPAE